MKYDEIIQKQYGSCFFLSTISSMILRNPSIFDKTFVVSQTSATAQFFKRSRFLCFMRTKEFPIVVNKTLDPIKSAHPEWAGLFEKCYAEFAGGISLYDRGGYPWTVFLDLTGKEAKIAYTTNESYKKEIIEANNNNKAIVADSMSEDIINKNPGSNIVPRHSYVVVTANENNLILRNPWGFFEPNNDAKNDGVFAISWEDFKKYFIRASYL